MKKTLATVCTILCFVAGRGEAQDYWCPSDQWCFTPSDFTVGLGIFYDTKSNDSFIPYLTILYNWFTAGFGVNGERREAEEADERAFTVVHYDAHLGFRYGLCSCLYVTGGASGEWGHLSGGRSDTASFRRHDPFVIGPYIGLDYHFAPAFMITAQILPYARERFTTGAFSNQFFEQGMIGVSYLF